MKKEIKRLSKLLTTKTRNNGEIFVCCKDDISEADRDLIRDFHGTDFLPDDFRFSTISAILDTMLEYDFNDMDSLEDLRFTMIDGIVDFTNYGLLQWLASNTNRADFCNQAIDEGLASGDIMSIISYGQFTEISEIFSNITYHLGEIEVDSEEVA